jgi:uncharacterized protein YkwD
VDRPRLLLAIVAGALLAGLAALATLAPTAQAGPNCTVDASIDSEEQAVLALINDHRQANGLGPLALSPTLNKAAAWKSQHMVDENYFNHNDVPIGRSWDDRIVDCGYSFATWIGENIAAGNADAQATFEQWRNSPGHNQNMLNSNYNAIGIGRAFGPNTTYGWYWTTDFGGYVDGAPSPPPPTNTPANTPPPTNTPAVPPPTSTPTNTPPPPTDTPANTPPAPLATNTPTDTPTLSPTEPPAPTQTPVGPAPTATAQPPAPTATNPPPPTPTATRPLPPPAPRDPDGDVSCDDDTGSLDAALILQLNAHIIARLPCPDAGDVNQDGHVDAIDALIVLQHAAGLIASLPI